MRRKVLIVVEGQTENAVLTNTVAPYLGMKGVDIAAKVVGKPGHKGGVYRTFETVVKEIINLTKQEPGSAISTYFDFYALPDDWPGVAVAKQAKAGGLQISLVAGIVENAWLKVISQAAAPLGRPLTFIPYVQMHELEALLFTDPQAMADVFLEPSLAAQFTQIRDEAQGCENINHRPDFAPSHRIEALFPGYKKGRKRDPHGEFRSHAPRITAKIGLGEIRLACPHFDEWIDRLEALSPPTE